METNKTPSNTLAGPKRKRSDTNTSTSTSTNTAPRNNKRQCLKSTLCLTSDDDTKVLGAVDARYEVHLQSVISSSKMQQRVSALLRHLTPPTPTQPPPQQHPSTTTIKTRVSVLRAKAPEAGKLISIAEIAKREIEKEQCSSNEETGNTGRWFQYITLGEEIQHRRRVAGHTIIEETVLGGPGAVGEEPVDDDEFEVMKTPFERAVEGQPVARGIPIMSLFLSRSPIEELKRRYGEQTNAA